MKINIKVLDTRLEDFTGLPCYATQGSAGIDLYAMIYDETMEIKAGETVLIPTGFAMSIGDENVAALLLPRSGLGHKSGIVLGNLVGLIDSDYTDQVYMSVWNRSANDYVIERFDRLAQMIFVPVIKIEPVVVNELFKTDRNGGFGHSGR